MRAIENFPEARARLHKMRAARWLDEATRAVTVETVFYNANLDQTEYLGFHIDISPGGRFQPYVPRRHGAV